MLSAYVGQLLLLRAAFAACGLEKVHISTVDAYQGEENDIVLLSLVRSNADGRLGFTSVDNRVCVALSRARLGFFCACNLPMLSGGSELWQKLLAHANKERRASPAIPLATADVLAAIADSALPVSGAVRLVMGEMSSRSHSWQKQLTQKELHALGQKVTAYGCCAWCVSDINAVRF